jgi:hypothetical protein
MVRKKGPTPRRRHAVEDKLRADYLALYEELGRAQTRAADAEQALALERREVDHLNDLYTAQTQRRADAELALERIAAHPHGGILVNIARHALSEAA